MTTNDILEYLKQKKNYINNDYKFYCIFENFYLKENDQFYLTKCKELDKKMSEQIPLTGPNKKLKNFISRVNKKLLGNGRKRGVKVIHCASLLHGFSEDDIGFIGECWSDESKENKSDDFTTAFKKVIESETLASKSVILLSQDAHHMERLNQKVENSFKLRERKRIQAASVKGQKAITEYFQIAKSSGKPTIKKSTEEPKVKLEKIISDKQRSNYDIKILWIPKGCDELNPVNYISILFSKHVVELMEENDNYDMLEACTRVIDYLPNELWPKILDYINGLEENYLTENYTEDENF